jgi:hypothetical protein
MNAENNELTSKKCSCGCSGRQVFRWWPYTDEGLQHKGQNMVACREHFNAVWAGEN